MAEVFANPLVDLAEYTDMKQDMDKGKGPVQISGVTDSQKVHVMHELSKDNPWRLVVTYDDTRAKEIFDDFSYFEPNTWLYPARDLLFYSSDIHGNLLTRQRMQVFKHLLEDEGGVVVTTVDGLMDHLLPLSMIKESCLNIMVGQTLDMEEIKHLLTGMGLVPVIPVFQSGPLRLRPLPRQPSVLPCVPVYSFQQQQPARNVLLYQPAMSGH